MLRYTSTIVVAAAFGLVAAFTQPGCRLRHPNPFY